MNLEQIAKNARLMALEMHHKAKDPHFGCALSIVEIMTALYYCVMNVDPSNPKAPNRDRFILSKAWAPSTVYTVMCQRGFFPKEALDTFALDGTKVASIGMPEGILPGVERSGGSAGQAFSVAAGMAYVSKAENINSRVFVLTGDGELQEGSNWEAAMFASARGLSNLKLIVDHNLFQSFGKVEDVIAIEPLGDKLRAFGWEVDEVAGHDIQALADILNKQTDKPHAIIANTIKGKGISFMEGSGEWHVGILNEEQYQVARKELTEENIYV